MGLLGVLLGPIRVFLGVGLKVAGDHEGILQHNVDASCDSYICQLFLLTVGQFLGRECASWAPLALRWCISCFAAALFLRFLFRGGPLKLARGGPYH